MKSVDGLDLSSCIIKIVNRYDHTTALMDIAVDDGSSVTTAINHYFLLATGDYVDALSLKIGDLLAGGSNAKDVSMSTPYLGYAASILTDPPNALVLADGVYAPSFVSKHDKVSTLKQIQMVFDSLSLLYKLCEANSSLCDDVNNMTTHEMADFASNFSSGMSACTDLHSCHSAMASVILPHAVKPRYTST